ncbi:MAG: hypothetical protein ACJASV_000264 [Pseudorhodobacter sp.]
MVKLVTFFLIAIAVLAMFGKLGWLGALAPKRLRKGKGHALGKPATCLHCGKHIIGKSGCDCRTTTKNKG